MIVNHTTGQTITLRALLALYPSIAAADNPRIGTDGIRGPWSSPPTDAELRTVGYSGVVETEQPEPGEGEQVRQGPHELIGDEWRQVWIVEPIPVYVPDSAQPHLLRRVLAAQGMLPAVQAYIDSLPADAPMRIDWEYAPSISRTAQGIETARVALGLTAEQVDALFIAAAAVQT